MASASNDLKYALRSFKKSPVFTAVAVLSLALGIGANTAIFTLLDQILLRLLPVKDPRQLVLLTMKGFHYGGNWGANALSFPMYRDFKANNKVFTEMFCRFSSRVSLGYNGQTERIAGELVSGTYFPTLGVGAALGRTFTPEEDRTPNGHPLVMLSYDYWKTRFSGDPSIIGKNVAVNSHNYTVIGVAEQGFDGVELGFTTQIFIPVMMRAQVIANSDQLDFNNRRQRWVNVFGRLKPGVSAEQAQASLQPFFHGILEMEVKEADFKNASADVRDRFLKNIIDVLPGSQGRSYLRPRLTKPLWVLMALTAGVLLIACANVASLLIARATSRQKEIAIRLAMGAGRFRIIRQLVVESLLLSAGGAILGLVLALWTDRILLTFLPPDTTSLKLSTTPDLRILLFTGTVALLTGIIFGLLPALQCTKPDVAPTLKDTVGGIVGGGASVRFRKGLVAAQVTLSLLLLVGAGLFIRSLRNLRDMGPGFATGNLVAFNVDPSLNGYDAERAKIFFRQLTDQINGIPGVHDVGLASMRILEENEWDQWVTIEGYRPTKSSDTPDPYMNSIGPGYLATIGVPILVGRDFTPKDTQYVQHGEKPDYTAPLVVLVNEKFAKRYFRSAGNAIGRHVGFGIDSTTKIDMEIVGVFKDIKYTNLRDEIPIQMCLPYLASKFLGGMTVYVRTTMDANQFFGAVRGKVRALDSNLPLYAMRTLDDQISKSLLAERLTASLSTVFGFLATLLAIIGLYGVMAFTVARRTREIGIRLALGAFQTHVIWMVMREVLVLVSIGIAAGLAGAIGLTRLVQAQLYGITAHDPATLALAAMVLAGVGCAAGYVPALRASRIDAMQALRYE
jgi:predicted permease